MLAGCPTEVQNKLTKATQLTVCVNSIHNTKSRRIYWESGIKSPAYQPWLLPSLTMKSKQIVSFFGFSFYTFKVDMIILALLVRIL